MKKYILLFRSSSSVTVCSPLGHRDICSRRPVLLTEEEVLDRIGELSPECFEIYEAGPQKKVQTKRVLV